MPCVAQSGLGLFIGSQLPESSSDVRREPSHIKPGPSCQDADGGGLLTPTHGRLAGLGASVCAALSGLGKICWDDLPRAALVPLRLPWAVIFRAFSPVNGDWDG